jgi:hypothetical protein
MPSLMTWCFGLGITIFRIVERWPSVACCSYNILIDVWEIQYVLQSGMQTLWSHMELTADCCVFWHSARFVRFHLWCICGSILFEVDRHLTLIAIALLVNCAWTGQWLLQLKIEGWFRNKGELNGVPPPPPSSICRKWWVEKGGKVYCRAGMNLSPCVNTTEINRVLIIKLQTVSKILTHNSPPPPPSSPNVRRCWGVSSHMFSGGPTF